MKRLNILNIIIVSLLLIIFQSCKDSLTETPHNGGTFQQAVSSPNNLKIATNGAYGLMEPYAPGFWRPYSNFITDMGTAPSDNVSLGVTTPDPIQHSFDYQRSVSSGNILAFWRRSYKIIYTANQNIQGADKMLNGSGLSSSDMTDVKQLKGENLFLRAKTYFDLVRVFGRPYSQNPSQNLGVPVVTQPKNDIKPKRATVKAVYKQIVSDLKSAASLMTKRESSSYGSKPAAEALLSRVYLYMGDNQNVITYADKVINSGRYQLLSTQDYPKMFSMGNVNNPEDIFAVNHANNQSFKWDSYSSLYYTDPSGVGWGQWFASTALVNLLNEHPNDIRRTFIDPQYNINSNGDTTGVKTLNDVPEYFITKFTGKFGQSHNSDMVYMRYAEVFLNRAEAYAKLNMDSKAIADVNKIRKRAGLQDSAMYNASNMTQKQVLNAVLKERRLEFYEEGHRAFDLYRNNLPMQRNYPSVVGGHMTVQPDSYNIIWPIPKNAIFRNPNLKQNPGYGSGS
ncbi:MAG TPA: RagB/SusD family nutrient uptake outer membrane protein [Balneolaceae bacterium]|nr:RagB/SusD family nutrient uptake outer membrane protein [Balneolaceae bacterium]